MLGCSGDEGLWALEDSGPLLDSLEIVAHGSVCARSDIHLEVVDEGLKLLDGSENVEGLEVLERVIEVGPERRDSSVAGLHLGQVVLTNHAVDETSGKLRDANDEAVGLLSWGLNRADSDGKEVSSGLASLEVLSSVPVGLDGLNVTLDLLSVEDHVLGHGGDQRAWVLEDGCPGLDGLNLVTHALASGKSSLEGSDGGSDILSSLEEVSSLDGLDKGGNVIDGLLTIGEAGLDLSEVVVSNETLKKTTNEQDGSIKRHVSNTVLDGANSEGKSGGSVLTGVEVVTSRPVSLFLSNVLLDLVSVEKPVLGNSLRESSWVGEDGGPLLDGSDVVIHALAGGHSGANFVPGLAGILDALEVVTSLEVGNGGLSVGGDLLTTLVASLDLSQVVVTGHTVHESGNEVGDGHGVEGRCRSGNNCGSESFHLFLFCLIL